MPDLHAAKVCGLVQNEMSHLHLAKICALIILVGVLWGGTPYLERQALLQTPKLSVEYFQFWRGLLTAIIILAITLIQHKANFQVIHSPMTWKNLGFTMAVSVPTVVYMLAWLYLARKPVLHVSVSYSIAIGVSILTSVLIGYFARHTHQMGKALRPENYVGIVLIIVGVALVGLDLKTLGVASASLDV